MCIGALPAGCHIARRSNDITILCERVLRLLRYHTRADPRAEESPRNEVGMKMVKDKGLREYAGPLRITTLEAKVRHPTYSASREACTCSMA